MSRFLTSYHKDKLWRQSHGLIDSIVFFPKAYKNQSLWERKAIEVQFWAGGMMYQVLERFSRELLTTAEEKRSNSNEIFLCIYKIIENGKTS